MSGSTKVSVSYEDSARNGRFVVRITGLAGEGELTFSRASDALVIADHTWVPDTLRGMGAGRALVEALIMDAREKSYCVMSLCPFVRAQSLKHPEWADVVEC
jgi:predicted GNAT family acetyltransferase